MGMKEENIDTSQRVGCVIGAHTGPEVCVVTFSGDPDELSLMNDSIFAQKSRLQWPVFSR